MAASICPINKRCQIDGGFKVDHVMGNKRPKDKGRGFEAQTRLVGNSKPAAGGSEQVSTRQGVGPETFIPGPPTASAKPRMPQTAYSERL
jgi:hypothetical protein